MTIGLQADQFNMGMGPVRFCKFVLDHDDIQFLIEGSNPKLLTVLEAPGDEDLLYRVVGAVIKSDLTAGAYTLDGSYLLNISATNGLLGGELAESGEAFPLIPTEQAVSVTESFLPKYSKGGDGTETADLVNAPLVIQSVGDATTISGGHADNTVTGIIEYRLLNHVTMQYV